MTPAFKHSTTGNLNTSLPSDDSASVDGDDDTDGHLKHILAELDQLDVHQMTFLCSINREIRHQMNMAKMHEDGIEKSLIDLEENYGEYLKLIYEERELIDFGESALKRVDLMNQSLPPTPSIEDLEAEKAEVKENIKRCNAEIFSLQKEILVR